VEDPRTDYWDLYDEDYYNGHGADALVHYHAEMTDPRTIRQLEWSGIEELVGQLVELKPTTSWLDMGCGLGGLVRHLRARGYSDVHGFDEGYGSTWADAQGIPILSEEDLQSMTGRFEVITAIEVIEHIVDPMPFLRRATDLLAPGGVLFLTTGNVEMVRSSLDTWSYIVPDVHVSFFGPTSLRHAFECVGLGAEQVGFRAGHDQIIRYKVLKNLRRTRQAGWHRIVPWKLASRAVDRVYGVSALPAGRKPPAPD
jgi:cyclopropane fatty-acyl-phospholipid synthase-like methyltransferase